MCELYYMILVASTIRVGFSFSFHNILLLILSLKILFIKDSLMNYLSGSWETKVLESWFFSEPNYVNLSKSLKTSLCFSYLVL
jgi:hypothetical protein